MNVRSLLAVALAALLAPLAASAQTRGARATSTPASANAFSLGGWIGPELGDADGFQLRADGELPFQQLTPQLGLSLVGSLGYTFASYDTFGGDVTVNRFKIVPTARFTFPLNPKVSFFGDAGLGLHYTSVTVDFGFGDEADDSEVGLMLRFGGGAFFQVAPKVRLGAQLVLDPMFGDYDDTTFSILGGAMFTL